MGHCTVRELLPTAAQLALAVVTADSPGEVTQGMVPVTLLSSVPWAFLAHSTSPPGHLGDVPSSPLITPQRTLSGRSATTPRVTSAINEPGHFSQAQHGTQREEGITQEGSQAPCLMTDRHQCFPIRRTTIDTGVRTFDGVLKKNIDIEYNGFEWIRVASWTNATAEAQGHNYSYWKDMVLHPDHRYSATNDFEIDSPKTVDDSNWNILDSLIGLDFVLGHEEDTQAPRVSITARDATSNAQKFEDRIIVPEYSQFHLYQRRIFFTAIVWFQHYPSPPEGPAEVLHWLGLRPVRLYTGIRYNTSDVLTTTTVLEGSDSSSWSSLGRNKRPPVGENAFLLHTRSEYMRYIASLGSCEPSLCSNADTPMEVDDEMPT